MSLGKLARELVSYLRTMMGITDDTDQVANYSKFNTLPSTSRQVTSVNILVNCSSLFLPLTDDQELFNIVINLPNNFSCGLDEVPTCNQKYVPNEIFTTGSHSKLIFPRKSYLHKL